MVENVNVVKVHMHGISTAIYTEIISSEHGAGSHRKRLFLLQNGNIHVYTEFVLNLNIIYPLAKFAKASMISYCAATIKVAIPFYRLFGKDIWCTIYYNILVETMGFFNLWYNNLLYEGG